MIWSYFGVYFPRCFATREINTKITLSWLLNQFVTRVHTLFSIKSPMFPRLIWLALGQLHHCPHTSEVSLKNGSETDFLILGMHWLFSNKSGSIETIMFRTVITHLYVLAKIYVTWWNSTYNAWWKRRLITYNWNRIGYIIQIPNTMQMNSHEYLWPICSQKYSFIFNVIYSMKIVLNKSYMYHSGLLLKKKKV